MAKSQYPISIAEAKRQYRTKTGHSLKMGYEAPIMRYKVPLTIPGSWNGLPFPYSHYTPTRQTNTEVTLYLVNESGKYRLREG